MPAIDADNSKFRFGVFEVDLEARELRKSGLRIHLQPQPFEILALLTSRPGQLVSREELQQKLWSNDTFVDFERSLNTAVKKLRSALNDDAETPRYIETIPRRGYRIVIPVVPVSANEQSVPPPGKDSERFPVKTLGIIVALVFLLAVAGYLGFRRPGRNPQHRVMLAIMPFENFDPRVQEYFCDGLTEELIADLGETNPSSLGVIARTSAMHYKGTHETLATIGRELNADYVVEGSVRQQDERVRITVQLIRVSDQSHLWAQSYDRDFEKALTLETELAQEVAKKVSTLVPSPEALAAQDSKRHTADPEAEQLYLQGRYYWNRRNSGSLRLSQSSFQKAIDLDPNYSLAYSGLADADFVLSISGAGPSRELMPAAEAAALKAIQLDPTLAEAHTSLAQILADYDWNWAEAEREYRRATELNPNYSIGHLWYGAFLMDMGRSREAIAEIGESQKLDPLSSLPGTFLGWSYFYNREYDKAIAQYQKVLRIDPGFPMASSFLVRAYEQAGRFDDAIAESRRAIPLDSGDVKSASQYADALAAAYNAHGADGYWEKRLELSHSAAGLGRAALLAELGRSDEAFANLEQAYAQRDMWLALLRVDPRWDRIRSDSRFASLMRRVGLK